MAQTPTTFQPVGNMRQLMIDIIYPTSDAIFYVDREPPKNQHDWDVLRTHALTLAESGNLLMMEGRARDQKNWIMESKMLVGHRRESLQGRAGQGYRRDSRAQ